MSVTIVQAPPQTASSTASTDSAQGGSAASAANDSSAEQNFAALLFGQMIPLSASVVQNVQQQVANKDETQQDSDTETNPNALIAALSAIPVDTRQEVAAPTGDSTAAAATSNDRSRTAPSLADLKGSNAKTETVPSAVSTEAAAVTPPQTSPTDDKAAKFAVPVAAAVAAEVKTAEPLSADTASANTNTLSAAAAAAAGGAKQAPATVHHDSAELTVQTPVRDANWANDLGQKVVWLANNDKQSAQITLNPPQMGPIEVSVKIDNGSATASFVSASQETRDALETAMPRLREMFASAGIELGQTNVGAESFRQQTASDYNGSSGNATRSDDNAILGTSATIPLTSRVFGGQQGNGRVDIFA